MRTVKKVSAKTTPLAVAVEKAPNHRTTPLDILKMARRHWLKGEKFSIDGLSKESGISRVTIYRWVGTKEYLMGEVLWSAFEPGLKEIMQGTPGTGIEHIVEVHRRLMDLILSFPPMQRFVEEDPAYALRLITTDATCVRGRSVQAAADHLAEQDSKGYIRLTIPATELAEMIIRTNESLMYSDIVSGRSPAIDQASNLDRMLLIAGTAPIKQEHASQDNQKP